ncbi:Uncharacterised protein [Bordetella pertussis]|nr:Uncharacterised protein [Bordetella pertussis]
MVQYSRLGVSAEAAASTSGRDNTSTEADIGGYLEWLRAGAGEVESLIIAQPPGTRPPD